MISYPPMCSKKWTSRERLNLIKWIADIMLDRMSRDNPDMKIIAKNPTVELFRCIDMLASGTVEQCEFNREAFEKPYNPDLDRNGLYVVGNIDVR